MTVADLFINIGIKGGNKVGDTLTGVHKGLGEVKSMSLEAKAGILAVVYGLEKFMSESAHMGMSLKQFSEFTGLSTDALQRWQYAARQSGVEAGEVTGSIKGIQSAIAQMQLGKGPPGGIGMIAHFTGGFDKNKMNDTFYMMEKLKQFSRNTAVPKPFANEFLKSFGLTDNMIQFLRTTKTDLNTIKPSAIFSGGEINELSKVSVAWDNLGGKMQMAFGHLTSAHGLKIVSEISTLTDQVLKMVSAFATLAEKLKVFQVIGLVFDGWEKIFSGINSIVSSVAEETPAPNGKSQPGLKGGSKKKQEPLRKQIDNVIGKGVEFLFPQLASNWVPPTPGIKTDERSVLPKVGSDLGRGSQTNTTTVNNTITHYGDAKDTKAVEDTHKKAAQNAYRQKSAQLQVN